MASGRYRRDRVSVTCGPSIPLDCRYSIACEFAHLALYNRHTPVSTSYVGLRSINRHATVTAAWEAVPGSGTAHVWDKPALRNPVIQPSWVKIGHSVIRVNLQKVPCGRLLWLRVWVWHVGFRLKGLSFRVVGLGAKQNPLDILCITGVWCAIRICHMNCFGVTGRGHIMCHVTTT